VGYDPHNHTPNVFLSYRREDVGAFALWLGERLKRDLRLENVFLDVRDVFGGDDWRRVIADRIAASDVVIAVIGVRWAGPRADGTWRIFDHDDVVRWELGHALSIRPSHVVPTMLNGARLPSALPPELTPLYRAQRLDLRPSDSSVCYSELLADVFMKTHYRRGSPIIITDGSDHAEAYLDRLAHQLRNGQLGMHGVVAVTAVTRGFSAISLREASVHWPDVIILRHPGAADEKLAALARGARRNALKVVEAGAIGATAGVTFDLGRSLIQPPSTPDPSLGPDPSGAPSPSTSAPPSSASSPGGTASRAGVNGPANSATPTSTTGALTTSAKTGLGLAAKLAAAGLVAVAVVVGATLVSSVPGLSPTATAPTQTTQEPAPGTGPSPTGAPPSKRPSIMPTECSTDPFWGTNGEQSRAEPGTTLNCVYSYKNTSGYFPISSITVFDGTTPLPLRARETKESGQKVPIEGTDAAWTLYKPPPNDISHILISSANESLLILYHGNSDDGIEHAKRLLRLG
jgi:hypothetical protein